MQETGDRIAYYSQFFKDFLPEAKVDINANAEDHGLDTYDSSSSIHLLSPLTKEIISTNNGGGGNFGGGGTIATVGNEGTDEEIKITLHFKKIKDQGDNTAAGFLLAYAIDNEISIVPFAIPGSNCVVVGDVLCSINGHKKPWTSDKEVLKKLTLFFLFFSLNTKETVGRVRAVLV